MLPGNIEFISNSGGSVVSRRILEGTAPLKWMVREQPINPSDNGWRFFSAQDDEDFLADQRNLAIVTFNDVANIEPAVLSIYQCPIGSDLALVRDENKRILIIDNLTGTEIHP